MEANQLVLLDPLGIPVLNSRAINPRPKSVERICVGMLDNTKPNFDIFLDTVEELLLKNYKVGSIVRHKKPGRTVPVSQEVMEDLKKRCDIVITGLGD